MVLTGTGDMQMDVLVSKLKSRFNVEAELKAPRVAYREKIRKTVSKQGRHKSRPAAPASSAMSGSALSPIRERPDGLCRGGFGGSVPKNYFPAVEKGLRKPASTDLWRATPW